jgi:hypothetical protein
MRWIFSISIDARVPDYPSKQDTNRYAIGINRLEQARITNFRDFAIDREESWLATMMVRRTDLDYTGPMLIRWV